MKKMKKKPLVCIIIINWNGKRVTLNCLESLFQKTSYLNYKVIVLDNGSDDDSPERISKKFKKVDLIKLKKNMGYTRGINYAWTYCLKNYNPDYICNMNNDIITIQEDWLDLMVRELEKEEKRGICGNKLIFPEGGLQLLWAGRPRKGFKEKDYGQYDFVKEVEAVGGANLLVKKKVIQVIKGLDENFFYGPDDIDYCLRARKGGFKIIYNGNSKSIHLGSFSYLAARKNFIFKHQSHGQIIFAFRHRGIPSGIEMTFRQLIRVFFTRKDPFKEISLSNTYFHKNFLYRGGIFVKSFFRALYDYPHIKNKNFIINPQ